MRSSVVIDLFFIAAAAACSSSQNGTVPCTSACPDGYVCGKDNRCWLVGTPDGAGGSSDVSGTGGGATVSTGGIDAGEIAAGGAGGGAGGMASADAGVVRVDGADAPADALCGLVTVQLVKQTPEILIILDSSSSMTRAMDSTKTCPNDAGICQQRWAAIASGLSSVLSASTGVYWGLKLFSSDGACGVTPTMDVPISPGAAATIPTTIASMTPHGNTPTRDAINAGAGYLQNLTDSSGKYILLATDGEPNCLNSGRDAGVSSLSDLPGTVNAIAAAGFPVFVVGVGPETGNLDNFAAAGGTDHYHPVLSAQDLTDALFPIVHSLASCVFSLGKAPPPLSNVAITFNGDKNLRAPQDTTHVNGWDYLTPAKTSIRLYGSWCDNVANGTYSSVEILVACPGMASP